MQREADIPGSLIGTWDIRHLLSAGRRGGPATRYLGGGIFPCIFTHAPARLTVPSGQAQDVPSGLRTKGARQARGRAAGEPFWSDAGASRLGVV